MLTLTLKEGEYFMLGEDICVRFIKDLSANSIRIGIEAPKDVNIIRGKAYEKVLSSEADGNPEKLKEIQEKNQLSAELRSRVIEKEQARKARRKNAV